MYSQEVVLYFLKKKITAGTLQAKALNFIKFGMNCGENGIGKASSLIITFSSMFRPIK